MQAGAALVQGRVSYLPVVGEATRAGAVPFLNTLVAQRCDLVVAVGSAQVAAVQAAAPDHRGLRFGVVGGSGAPSANVVSLPQASAREGARQLVVDSVPEPS
jgi:basic membrane lipoprotein Med (substrate-binding protein (PBP1-ABC) superfamily)